MDENGAGGSARVARTVGRPDKRLEEASPHMHVVHAILFVSDQEINEVETNIPNIF